MAATCDLQCVNNNYAVDDKGCPICACASDQATKPIGRPPKHCRLLKCRPNCGEAGYKSDINGCRTCECASKPSSKECPRAMCRMFCAHGFRRDENGCETCSCNDSPQPCPKLNCENICLNGYRKDYSGKIEFFKMFIYSFFFQKVVQHVHVTKKKLFKMVVHQ